MQRHPSEESATCGAVTDGSITLGVAVGSRHFITGQLLSKADVIRAMHGRVQLCEDAQDGVCPPRETLGVSPRSGSGLSNSSSPGLTEDSMTQATLSAGQSGIGFKRARGIAAPALITAELCIQAMIRDAVWEGLHPEQILEARLSEVIDTATSTNLRALDNDELSNREVVCSEGRQQTIGRLHGPVSQTRPSHPSNIPSSASQDENSDEMDFSTASKEPAQRAAAPSAAASGFTTWTRAREVS